jgi:hypothetical protein
MINSLVGNSGCVWPVLNVGAGSADPLDISEPPLARYFGLLLLEGKRQPTNQFTDADFALRERRDGTE